MTQLKPINQQVVAIVGASSGIGRDIALKFAARGAKVVVAARSEPGLASLVEVIQKAGGEAGGNGHVLCAHAGGDAEGRVRLFRDLSLGRGSRGG